MDAKPPPKTVQIVLPMKPDQLILLPLNATASQATTIILLKYPPTTIYNVENVKTFADTVVQTTIPVVPINVMAAQKKETNACIVLMKPDITPLIVPVKILIMMTEQAHNAKHVATPATIAKIPLHVRPVKQDKEELLPLPVSVLTDFTIQGLMLTVVNAPIPVLPVIMLLNAKPVNQEKKGLQTLPVYAIRGIMMMEETMIVKFVNFLVLLVKIKQISV